jgi:ankyrin repeat protein
MWTAFNGYTEIAKQLIAHGAEVNIQDTMNRTALMFAASGPNIDTVRLLLSHEAEVNIQDGHEGWTALMFAAAEGQGAIVQALLDAGADPGLTDVDGESAYHFAQQRGQSDVMRMLKAAADSAGTAEP